LIHVTLLAPRNVWVRCKIFGQFVHSWSHIFFFSCQETWAVLPLVRRHPSNVSF